MTIKELEERTGMARANIRYYEEEGLISPERKPNGYRDYSEEDVRTLEKIRLLRQLHLDIETIRLVQTGQLSLEQALFSLLNRLEGDKTAIGRAVEICRELERSGTEYSALDPHPWLERLERSQRPQLTPPPKTAAQYDVRPRQEQTDYAYYHPWLRLLARMVDVSIHGLVIDALILLVFRWHYYGDGALAEWFVGLLQLGFTLLCEPFWLHFWGWTPGKWMLGLKVRGPDGRRLALWEGAARAGRVFVSGYGGRIPFVDLWCAWKFWKRYKNEEDCPWDEATIYTHEERRLSWLMWLGAAAMAGFLTVTIVLQSLLPPNRSDLTAAEYYENVNFYLKVLGVDDYRVDENGRWGLTYGWTGSAAVSFNNVAYSDFSVQLEDGAVVSVTLSDYDEPETRRSVGADTMGGDWVYMDQFRYWAATLALAGAQREFNCFNFDESGWLELWDDQWNDFEVDWRGLHISQRVECSGYEGRGQVRTAIEGKERSYLRAVTISLIGDD